MGIKRVGGYTFVTWVTDHPPLHVHIYREGALLGKFDIESRRPIGNLMMTRRLQRALEICGYLRAKGK